MCEEEALSVHVYRTHWQRDKVALLCCTASTNPEILQSAAGSWEDNSLQAVKGRPLSFTATSTCSSLKMYSQGGEMLHNRHFKNTATHKDCRSFTSYLTL